MDPILERYQALEDKVSAYTPGLDTQRLYRAFTYADAEHKGQLRKDGTPYITHPLAVAEIVADLGLDADSVIAALLHDTIEDTNATTQRQVELVNARLQSRKGAIMAIYNVDEAEAERKMQEIAEDDTVGLPAVDNAIDNPAE